MAGYGQPRHAHQMKTTTAVAMVALMGGPPLAAVLAASPCCALMSGEDSASEPACTSWLAPGSAACVLQGQSSRAPAHEDGMRLAVLIKRGSMQGGFLHQAMLTEHAFW